MTKREKPVHGQPVRSTGLGSRSSEIPDDWTTLPSTAAEARRLGIRYCFTGKPCQKGHIAPRRATNSDCCQCSMGRSVTYTKRKRDEDAPVRDAVAIERKRLNDEQRPAREAAAKVIADEARRRAIADAGDTEGYYMVLASEAREKYWRDPEHYRKVSRERKRRGLAGYRMLRLRTPPWLTAEELQQLAAFYPAPAGMHTDHIVPIGHHVVAGLHVPGNLQHMKSRHNIKKYNDLDCSYDEAADFVKRGLAVWADDVNEVGEIDWSKYPRPSGL